MSSVSAAEKLVSACDLFVNYIIDNSTYSMNVKILSSMLFQSEFLGAVEQALVHGFHPLRGRAGLSTGWTATGELTTKAPPSRLNSS